MKPRKIHTIESLYERTTEEGDCRLWDGYMVNGVPMAYHNGKMTSVRKIIDTLSGKTGTAKYYGCTCGNPSCIDEKHIAPRTSAEHAQQMGKRVSESPGNQARIIAITLARRKGSNTNAEAIRNAEGSYRYIANQEGISRNMVGRIKRGEYWRDLKSPWAGLGAR